MFRYLLTRFLSFLGLLEYITPPVGTPLRETPEEPKSFPSLRRRDRDKAAISAAEAKRARKNARRAREFYGKEE